MSRAPSVAAFHDRARRRCLRSGFSLTIEVVRRLGAECKLPTAARYDVVAHIASSLGIPAPSGTECVVCTG